MAKFAQEGVTAMILINKSSLPPFTNERRFLADAESRGVSVWIRTNRVSPKRGVPGRSSSTLDFALDETLQQETLDYLLALASLSRDHSSLTGLVIGGEEFVGAKIDQKVLNRYQTMSTRQLGFSIAGRLNDSQQIHYFDWLQNLQNEWYSKLWDRLKAQFPKLELFIYPSAIAVCGERFSSFPRPAYWDIHDLIVTRKKHYSVILPSYTTDDPLGADLTWARAMYLRAATEALVPYFLLLQFHRTRLSRPHPPNLREMETQVLASVDGGASGVGFWPVDMDTRKDLFELDRKRWEDCFGAIAGGASRYPQSFQGSGLFLIKPRYSQYWVEDNQTTLRIFALLRRNGLQPEFLLVEQILDRPLPHNAKCFYLPSTFKYERPEVWTSIQSSGKHVFFSQGSAELSTPDKKTVKPLYELLGLQKNETIKPKHIHEPRTLRISWKGVPYELSLPPPSQSWKLTNNFPATATASVEAIGNGLPPLAFRYMNLIFLSIMDYDLLSNSNSTNQNSQFMKELSFN